MNILKREIHHARLRQPGMLGAAADRLESWAATKKARGDHWLTVWFTEQHAEDLNKLRKDLLKIHRQRHWKKK